MSTWIKETKKAIYWMEGSEYIDKVEKSPLTGTSVQLDITELKKWFSSENPPGKMVVVDDESPEPSHKLFPHGSGGEHIKPSVEFIRSPNFNSRNGTKIDHIIVHNTDSTFDSAINTFKSTDSQVSAHYIINRNGQIVQMVEDSNRAWHAGDGIMNSRSIGIEHVADENNKGLTSEQEKASIDLIKSLMSDYAISLDNVKPHRDVSTMKGGTDCPKWIWKDDSNFEEWKNAKLKIDLPSV